MSEYSLKIFPVASATYKSYDQNVLNPLTQANANGGEGWQYGSQPWAWPSGNYSGMTVAADASTQAISVKISDTDSTPDQLDDYADQNGSQVLTDATTIDGTTWPAGTIIEDEYEISLTDENGVSYRLVAVGARMAGSYDNPQIVGYLWDGTAPPDGTTLTYVYNSNSDSQNYAPSDNGDPPCFTPGTLIDTPDGARAIETLVVGDLVSTARGPQPIRWIGSRHLDAAQLDRAITLRPIRIAAGALGAGLPEADLLVSPQHRMLLRSAITERMAGTREALVAAKHLVGMPGITIAECREVTYLHLLFDGHEIVHANGAETESLYLGAQALIALGGAARAEIAALFPELRFDAPAITPARRILSGRVGRKLAARHSRNGKALIEKSA